MMMWTGILLIFVYLTLPTAESASFRMYYMSQDDWIPAPDQPQHENTYGSSIGMCSVACQLAIADGSTCEGFRLLQVSGQSTCQFGSPKVCSRVFSPHADTAIRVALNTDVFGTKKVTELHAGSGRKASVYGNGLFNETVCTDASQIFTIPKFSTAEFRSSALIVQLRRRRKLMAFSAYSGSGAKKTLEWNFGDSDWSDTGSTMDHEQNGAGAAALGDGGAILVGSWGKTDKVQILEEGGGGWKTVEPYPEGGMRYPHVEAKTSSTIYVIGGEDTSNDNVKTTYRYDKLTDSWTKLQDAPFELGLQPNCGRVRTGFRGVSDGVVCVATSGGEMSLFDLDAEQWTNLETTATSAVPNLGSLMFVKANRLYRFRGGTLSGAHRDLIDYFDLDTETWSSQETSPATSLTRHLQVKLEVDAFVVINLCGGLKGEGNKIKIFGLLAIMSAACITFVCSAV